MVNVRVMKINTLTIIKIQVIPTRFDCILCCEVLEHFPFETSCAILEKIAQSQVPYVILSVPYQGFQFRSTVYLNRYGGRKSTSFQFRNWLRKFKPQPKGLHQWEIGYKGYPLKKLEKALGDCGLEIVDRQFTGGTRSVFLIAKNLSAQSNSK